MQLKKLQRNAMKGIFRSAALLAVCFICLFSSGCDSHDQGKCYESVTASYPEAEVIIIPGEKYRFIVKTLDGAILYIETMNQTDTNITQIFTVFK